MGTGRASPLNAEGLWTISWHSHLEGCWAADTWKDLSPSETSESRW